MEAEFKKALGRRLRTIRTESGMTQEELGNKIDRTPEAISNLERGEVLPHLETLRRISTALNVALSDLLMGIGASPSEAADETERDKLNQELLDIARKMSNEDVRLSLYQMRAIFQFRKETAIKLK